MARNPYLNINTLKYQKAIELDLLTRQVIVTDYNFEKPQQSTFIIFPIRFDELLSLETSYLEIYQQLQQQFPDIIVSDFIIFLANRFPENRLKQINKFYFETGLAESPNFLNEIGLNQRLEAWSLIDKNTKIAENKQYTKIMKYIEIYKNTEESYPPLYYSEPNLSSLLVNLKFRFVATAEQEARDIKLEDGLDIFNQARLTSRVPFLAYREHDDSFYSKVWTGVTKETSPDYENSTTPPKKMSESNKFYLVLWTGDLSNKGEEVMHLAPRDNFQYLEYSLIDNKLAINIRIDNPQSREYFIREILIRLKEVFPFLEFDLYGPVRLVGSFRIYDVNFQDFLLSDMLLVDFPQYREILINDENAIASPFRSRYDLYFRPLLSSKNTIHFNLKNKSYVADSRETIRNQVFVIKQGTPYIEVKIYDSKSIDELVDFIYILSAFFAFYRNGEYRKNLLALYQHMSNSTILSLERNKKKFTEKYEKKTTYASRASKKDNIFRLRQQYPNIFVDKYSEVCQKGHAPVVLSPEEIPEWETKRQLMNYPPLGPPIFTFACPDERYPYPGLQPNYHLKNREKYKYIPCCFASDQTVPGRKTGYNKYLAGIDPGEKVSQGERGLITSKILASRRVGQIPSDVQRLLESAFTRPVNLIRIGTPRSTNSLLHAISMAINDPVYSSAEINQNTEEYVQYVRALIASPNQTIPSLVKQECFDFSDEQIVQSLSNNNTYLDPRFFYRAVEEFYGINIYVFQFPGLGEKHRGKIMIPRHKMFPIHILQTKRPTVCLIEIPSNDPIKPFGQIEAIGIHFPEVGHQMVFDNNVNTICHQALLINKSTYTFKLYDNRFIIHRDIYSLINYLDLLDFQVISQYLDSYGKLRILNFQSGSQKMSVMILPNVPLNYPEDEHVYPVPKELASSIFGAPSGQDPLGTGYWFQILDITEGIFVPTGSGVTKINEKKIIGEQTSYPVLSYDPIRFAGEDSGHRYEQLHKNTNIFVQLVKWLYLIASRDQSRFIDPPSFSQYYGVISSEIVSDSLNFYDFSKLPRFLPVVENMNQALMYLENLAPTIVTNGKIIYYDSKFYLNINNLLVNYRNFLQDEFPGLPSYLYDYYVFPSDFEQQAHVKIFTSLSDFVQWKHGEIFNYDKTYSIYRSISKKMVEKLNPYVYHDTNTNTFYLIQNVLDGDFYRAQAVCQQWRNNGINTGYNSAPVSDSELFPYRIFIIDHGILKVLQDSSSNTPHSLQILDYSYLDPLHFQNKYASILRLA